MPEIVNPAVEQYAEAHTSPPGRLLAEVAARTRADLGDRAGMMVGAIEGRFLELVVFALGARSILEIGTFTGYSSLAMAAGMAPGGRIVTCDIDPSHLALARRHIAGSPYSECIDVREGPAIETIETLPGPFDFVFIDADKTSYLAYYEAVLPKLAKGGLIAIDNTLWSGAVLDDASKDADTVAIRAFNDHVRGDPRVVSVQLTVRDGVTLVRLADGGDLS